ncbi:MAG: L-threonylcarbamoyladenylate synthase [Paludibacter sp.]|jgi:tRNA threonylcarbamoyl adenosine modification protein (Sua5/YciO/YrdC/YwlC family)
MYLKIYEDNPNPEQIRKVVEVLNNGGIIIFPTDTVYAFGCDIFNTRAVEAIVRIKNKDTRKPNLSFVCHEMSQISEYAKMDDAAFKLMKKNLPGPFTFLLRGNSRLPKLFKNKKEVGIRIPDNNIALSIVRELGNPMMVSSVFRDEDVPEYATDPELINEKFGSQVDLIIDGGMGGIEPSTVVDCTEPNEHVIVRQGVKELRE